MSAAVERVLGALRERGVEAKPSGPGKWQAKCPAHDDDNPSLSISEGQDGRAILHCFSGCPVESVVAALGLAMPDLFNDPPKAKEWFHVRTTLPKTAAPEAPRSTEEAGARESQGPQTFATFCATRKLDPARLASRWKVKEAVHNGRPCLTYPTALGVDRVKYLDDQKPKYTWTAKGGRSHLYGLRAAKAHGGPVLHIVNGEPSTWGCDQEGVAAVCLCGGEGAAPNESLIQELKASGFAQFKVVYDLDSAGKKGALATVKALRDAGLDAVALELPKELGLHGDVDDLHRREGKNLKAALETLPELAPETTEAKPATPAAKIQGRQVDLVDPEPWPDPVDGQALLKEIHAAIRRFVAMEDDDSVAVALWAVSTYAIDSFFIAPMLALASPEKRCGKTTCLNTLGALVSKPLAFANCTAAVLFRAVERYAPTLLIDEGDTFLHGKNADPELRGILNSGHTRQSAFVLRAVGDSFEPRQFSTWCPKAIALIGNLPGTLADRSVTIRLRRRAAGEVIERLRLDRLEDLAPLRRKARRWADDNASKLKASDPAIPAEITSDRAADNWRALISVADAVGGAWPEKARKAAVALSTVDDALDSFGIQLLADMRILFDEQGTDRLFSSDVVRALVELEDRPWGDIFDGHPLNARKLAKLLHPFGVIPGTIRTAGTTAKGYSKSQFLDAWERYLPPPKKAETPLSPHLGASQRHNPRQYDVSEDFASVTKPPVLRIENAVKLNNDATCDGVTDKMGGEGVTGQKSPSGTTTKTCGKLPSEGGGKVAHLNHPPGAYNPPPETDPELQEMLAAMEAEEAAKTTGEGARQVAAYDARLDPNADPELKRWLEAHPEFMVE
jgi:putative DNA primase/helicase